MSNEPSPTSPPTTAMAVANFFIELGNADPTKPAVDHLKLQKLVYFAYCWWAGNKSEPLFEEDIYAWKNGPVVRDLYEEFKSSGRDRIVEPGWAVIFSPGSKATWDAPRVPTDKTSLRNFLETVWRKYGHFTGIQLSNLSHLPTDPWYKAWHAGGGKRDILIPFELIRQTYAERVGALRDRATVDANHR